MGCKYFSVHNYPYAVPFVPDPDMQWLAEGFKNRRLFYPSSGDDIVDPIIAFLPYVDDFWFVDLRSRSVKNLLPKSKFHCHKKSHSRLFGNLLKHRWKTFTVEIFHCSYCHLSTDRPLTVNYCWGWQTGYNVFREAIKDQEKKLSVFYYRGHSQGEGGSGFRWLGKKMLRYILAEIEPGGLLVTDGSNSTLQLAKFFSGSNYRVAYESGADLVTRSDSFSHRGRSLECVGYLGDRYGPTLAWTVEPAVAE